MFSPGTVFAGRYRVERAIAKGGMGVVYEVVHLETERTRALKVMHDSAVDSPDLRERFRREARVTSRVESEFIVEVFDAGVDESTGAPFLVMEMLRGEEFGRLLRDRGRFSPSDVVTYLGQVARALDRTHAAMIVHRDLKPANLFLTLREDGTPRVKVLDFGIAKLLAEGDSQGTQSLGTPLYMSPEQLSAQSRVTAAADVYAFGLIAYTLLVGTPYWEVERHSAGGLVAFAVLASNGPKVSAVARAAEKGVALPSAFDAWFFKSTALQPDARWPSAGQAAAALAEALGEERPSFVGSPVSSRSGEPKPSAHGVATEAPTVVESRRTGAGAGVDTTQLTATDVSVTRRLSPAPSRRGSLALRAVALSALVLWVVVLLVVRRGGVGERAPAAASADAAAVPSVLSVVSEAKVPTAAVAASEPPPELLRAAPASSSAEAAQAATPASSAARTSKRANARPRSADAGASGKATPANAPSVIYARD